MSNSIIQKLKAGFAKLKASKVQGAYPLFHLEVTKDKEPVLHNTTSYPTYKEYMDQLSKHLREYSEENERKYGTGVEKIEVVVCSNGWGKKAETYTNGWTPVQSQDETKNIRMAYKVYFTDKSNPGWLLLNRFGTAKVTVEHSGAPLCFLARMISSGDLAWAAREQWVKSRRSR